MINRFRSEMQYMNKIIILKQLSLKEPALEKVYDRVKKETMTSTENV